MLTVTEERLLKYIEDRARENIKGKSFYKMTDILEQAFWISEEKAYEVLKNIISRKNIGNSKDAIVNEYIDIFDEQITQSKIEENLQDLTYSNCIIRILDKSFDILKRYPEVGELYYSTLRYSYLEKEKYKENYILEHLAISRSTYFRVKKEAINLLSTIIWGLL